MNVIQRIFVGQASPEVKVAVNFREFVLELTTAVKLYPILEKLMVEYLLFRLHHMPRLKKYRKSCLETNINAYNY